MRVSRTLTRIRTALGALPPITDIKDRRFSSYGGVCERDYKISPFVTAPPWLFFPGEKLSIIHSKGRYRSDINNLGPSLFCWDGKGNGKTSVTRRRLRHFLRYARNGVVNKNETHQTTFSFLVQFPDGQLDQSVCRPQSLNVFPFSAISTPRHVPTS